MGPWNWRWFLRRDCRAIVSMGTDIGPDGERTTTVLLCKRRRFHRGPCGHPYMMETV